MKQIVFPENKRLELINLLKLFQRSLLLPQRSMITKTSSQTFKEVISRNVGAKSLREKEKLVERNVGST